MSKTQDQNDKTADPASTSQTQALRVLLGKGQAQPADSGTFLYEGRRYRGTFAYTSDAEVVNTVALEQYLYSVVPREMPHTWPASALQAQAVVARTYVLQRSSPAHEYDLVPSEANQVYTGTDAEHPETTAAVDATSGQVLRFGNGFAQVLYSSCCGGHTESNADAWGGKLLQYLAGVTCTYCTDSPWYSWTKNVTFDDLESALAGRLSPVGALQSVTLQDPDPSGRARIWRFAGANGTADVSAKDVRRLLGTRTLPSLLVRKIAVDGHPAQAQGALAIEGGGLGHGVGLCQWGARGMALTGSPARAILAFYYPGTGTGND
ncbi:MAG TPA: SpoIID/LytB domain-containing protein [Candidatus Baltobacteraceae bacterium]|nr:SpoIID/LytB domain-containing protein [Candidatus Baltobacteraceae bacterium]